MVNNGSRRVADDRSWIDKSRRGGGRMRRYGRRATSCSRRRWRSRVCRQRASQEMGERYDYAYPS